LAVFSRSFSYAVLTFALASQAFAGGEASDDSYWTKDPSAWQVEIYPIQLWVPYMSTRVTLPESSTGGTRPSGRATSSLDSAYSGGLRIEKNKWSVEGNFLWADLSADNTNPNVKTETNIELGQLMGGREILPGLSLEGGIRRTSLNMSAQLLDYPEVSRKPTLWDPLIGMTYRKAFGKKWRLDLHGDGGGFGAGSDVTYGANARLDWRFAKHFDLSFGYALLHFEVSDTVAQRTLTMEPTIHGPIIGFGVYF
jgi:hypothetical protein